jgi:hypothetical protein
MTNPYINTIREALYTDPDDLRQLHGPAEIALDHIEWLLDRYEVALRRIDESYSVQIGQDPEEVAHYLSEIADEALYYAHARGSAR